MSAEISFPDIIPPEDRDTYRRAASAGGWVSGAGRRCSSSTCAGTPPRRNTRSPVRRRPSCGAQHRARARFGALRRHPGRLHHPAHGRALRRGDRRAAGRQGDTARLGLRTRRSAARDRRRGAAGPGRDGARQAQAERVLRHPAREPPRVPRRGHPHRDRNYHVGLHPRDGRPRGSLQLPRRDTARMRRRPFPRVARGGAVRHARLSRRRRRLDDVTRYISSLDPADAA